MPTSNGASRLGLWAALLAFGVCALAMHPSATFAQSGPASESTMPPPKLVDPDAPKDDPSPAVSADPNAAAGASNSLAPLPTDTPAEAVGPAGLQSGDQGPAADSKEPSKRLPPWFPVILLVAAIVGGGLGFWWYGRFLEDVLRADNIRSPSNHVMSSVGIGISIFSALVAFAATGVLPFVCVIIALIGVIFNFAGSRHSSAYIVSGIAVVVGLGMGLLRWLT